MKILIANDDGVSRKILSATLRRQGHEIVETSSGSEAWETFDRSPVRMIISDWVMPGMDGISLCRKIRQRPDTDYTYFILLTGSMIGDEHRRRAMEEGADDFMTKGVDREFISMRVKAAERIIGVQPSAPGSGSLP